MQLRTTIIALGVGAAAAALSLPAAAAVTVYNLVTGSGCSTSSTTAYNNVRDCPAVDATGWSNTASSNTTLDSARVVVYSGGLGLTNKDGPGGPGDAGDANELDSDAPEHAIDNDQRKDVMRLTFTESVKLTHVQLGYTSGDSDITVLAFTGGACGGSVAGQTIAGLTACGWTLVSHIMNVPQQTGTSFTSINNTAGISSQWWLISTYLSDLANGSKTFTTSGGVGSTDSYKDHVKLLAVKGDPNGRVPEPGTLGLLGLAAVGFWGLRRKA